MSADKRKVIAQYCMLHYRWTEEQAKRLVDECIDKFLFLKRKEKDYKATKLSPSPMIDLVWHALILHSEIYIDICRGRYIHHRPSGESEGELQKKRYKQTLLSYVQTFKATPPQDMWPLSSNSGDIAKITIVYKEHFFDRLFDRTKDINVEQAIIDVIFSQLHQVKWSRIRWNRPDGKLVKSFDFCEEFKDGAHIHVTNNFSTEMYVATLMGKTHTIKCNLNDKIALFKQMICEKEGDGFGVDHYSLLHHGRDISGYNLESFDDLGIPGRSTFHLTLALRGC